MTESTSIALVRRLYESGMAPEVTAEILSSDLVWDITPGFLNGGVYRGWESVGRDFFGPILPNFSVFRAEPEDYFADDSGHVFVVGHYRAESVTGASGDVRFVHFWTIEDGKLTRLQQTADSYTLRELASA